MVARAAVFVGLRVRSSARVNEVAKLCRAVVLGDESKWSSEGSACGIEREFEVGRLRGREIAEDKSCDLDRSTNRSTVRSIVQESLFVTVCDGL